MSKKQRQSSKLLEPESFNVYKNTSAPIIVMLSCSELNIEILDADIETAESDDYRGMSRDDRNANSVFATIWEGARFSYKDGQKFINLFTQSISGLCQTSQLYPRTKEQEESSEVI